MEAKKKVCLLLVALLSLSGVQPAAAADYQASDYLPMAAGNSWTYEHEYYDDKFAGGGIPRYSAYLDTTLANFETGPSRPRFTIEVLNTEVIDGKTYYVISDMPANWPPAPPHFIAGKKLRWEGTRLMERTDDGEQAIFRFDGTTADYIRTNYRVGSYLISRFRSYLDFPVEESNVYRTRYAIPTTEGDNRVVVEAGLKPVPWYVFEFHGNHVESRGCDFLAGYGPSGFLAGKGMEFLNMLDPIRAVIGGTPVEFADALIPTGISSSSWGQIKQSWLAGERRDQ